MNCIFLRRGYGTSGDGVNYVEYIESSGTQYIDTGFKPNQDTRVVMDFQMLQASSTTAMFGARTSASSNNYAFCRTSSNFRSDYNKTYTQTWSGEVATRWTVDKNKNATTFNGSTQTYDAATFTCPNSMYLFAVNELGSARFQTYMKLYSCKIYDNGTLVRDYKPALDPDGVACLYDKVNKKYYYNIGTGTFTAGGSSGGGTAPTEYTIAVTGTGNSNYVYVTINGTKVTSAGSYTISPGNSISCNCQPNNVFSSGTITLNGTTVATAAYNSAAEYTFAPSGDCSIALTYSGSAACSIAITTT